MPNRLVQAVLLLVLAASPEASGAPRREAFGPPAPPTPFDLCDNAIREARLPAIPETLLPAIARVESGRLDPVAGRVRPWPWTINVEGVGSYFETKAAVIAAVQALQEKGTRSIDVGCMQVNLLHHPTAFPTLDAAFDPAANAAYAARFLSALHAQSRDWNLATAMYHSQSQDRGEDYQRRVFGRVMTPMGPGPRQGGAYGVWPPPGVLFGAIPPPGYSFGAFAQPPSALAPGPIAPPLARPLRR